MWGMNTKIAVAAVAAMIGLGGAAASATMRPTGRMVEGPAQTGRVSTRTLATPAGTTTTIAVVDAGTIALRVDGGTLTIDNIDVQPGWTVAFGRADLTFTATNREVRVVLELTGDVVVVTITDRTTVTTTSSTPASSVPATTSTPRAPTTTSTTAPTTTLGTTVPATSVPTTTPSTSAATIQATTVAAACTGIDDEQGDDHEQSDAEQGDDCGHGASSTTPTKAKAKAKTKTKHETHHNHDHNGKDDDNHDD